MITRKMYLEGKATHEKFYQQFVTVAEIETVKRRIGADRIKKSECPHFNDIPLREWDSMSVSVTSIELLKKSGDYWSNAGSVCILKRAAEMIRAGA